MDVEDLEKTLHPLSAVIYVPETDNGVIKIVHLSFREFMTSKIIGARPDLLCITEQQQSALVSDMFRIMHKELQFNISQLPTSYLRNSEVSDLVERLRKYVPLHLWYSCRFWVDHLVAAPYDDDCAQEVGKLLHNKFLFWLEVMSLLGMVHFASTALSKLLVWVEQNSPLAQFVTDATRFIGFFADAIVQSTPHIYISALAQAPTHSEIGRRFRPQFPNLLSVEKGQMAHWPFTFSVMEGHVDNVLSAIFSPDGRRICSCSYDDTIRVWDTATGEVLMQFEDPGVISLAFTPDAMSIVTCSNSHIISVWVTETGELQNSWNFGIDVPTTLSDDHTYSDDLTPSSVEDENNVVEIAAFSLDATQVVTSSANNFILWNLRNRTEISQFVGHTDIVTALAFSPDNRWILSGSNDCSVCLWDRVTAARHSVFTGHTERITSVKVSCNVKYIASGSWDNTVSLWDIDTNTQLYVFYKHTDQVEAIAFSPDDHYLASGSLDCSVCLWNTETGNLLRVFQGHIYAVQSVMFSPDCRWIVSGSRDFTVRVWDTETGKLLKVFEGHTDGITSLDFSRDGKCLVSGSEDDTIRIWNVETGEAVKQFRHPGENSLRAVAFSLNNECIFSGGESRINMWDAQTGEVLHTFSSPTAWTVAASPDGACFAIGTDCGIQLLDSTNGQALGEPLMGHTQSDYGTVYSVSFSPD
ncbi:WD40-repeat-containing domain protein, partial [Mycena capillaripes]